MNRALLPVQKMAKSTWAALVRDAGCPFLRLKDGKARNSSSHLPFTTNIHFGGC
jgi:hypothetical protein